MHVNVCVQTGFRKPVAELKQWRIKLRGVLPMNIIYLTNYNIAHY
jgi:hypothetical protein